LVRNPTAPKAASIVNAEQAKLPWLQRIGGKPAMIAVPSSSLDGRGLTMWPRWLNAELLPIRQLACDHSAEEFGHFFFVPRRFRTAGG
jgi:hypothetical protein